MAGNVPSINQQTLQQLKGLQQGLDASRNNKLEGSEVAIFKESARTLGIAEETVNQFLNGIHANQGINEKETKKIDVENFKTGKIAGTGLTTRGTKKDAVALQQQFMRDFMGDLKSLSAEQKTAVLAAMTNDPMPRPQADTKTYENSLQTWRDRLCSQAGVSLVSGQNTVTHLNQGALSRQIDERADITDAKIDEKSAEIIETVHNEGEQTRTTVQQEGDATREVVHKEGQGTRAEVRRQGRITRNTVRAEGAATRATVVQVGVDTQNVVRQIGKDVIEANHYEHVYTRGTVRQEGQVTREAVHQEGAAIRRHTFNEASINRLHSTFLSELRDNPHFQSNMNELADIATRVTNSRCSLEDKTKFMNRLIQYERDNYVFNRSELDDLQKEANALANGQHYKP